MKFKILSIVFIFILLACTVYAFSFGEDNIINNLVDNLGLNKPILEHKEKIIEKHKSLITAKAVTGESGACAVLNGICIGVGETCGLGYWLDPSLSNACSLNQQCCTENIIYLESMQSTGRAYVYSGISLVARIDPE